MIPDRINDEVDRVSVLRLLFRVNQIGVSHAVCAEHAERCLDHAVNGIGGTFIDRRVAARRFQCRKGVPGTLFQIDIANQNGYTKYFNILLLGGKNQRGGVVCSGVGVNDNFPVLSRNRYCLRCGCVLYGGDA